jgi:FAD/FMN-containing dehydrogenase
MNINEIRGAVKGEVTVDSADLTKYSRDASIFEIKPQAVVFPKDADDIKRLVQYVAKNKAGDPSLSLTARAAGTDMGGGPLTESLLFDSTRYMNHISDLHDLSVVVEPGVYFRDLEKVLNENHLMFPSFPASKGLCALGGMLANNAGGEKSLSYGKTENYVEEMSVVLADGNEYSFRELNEQELNQKMAQQNFEGEVYRKTFDLISNNYGVIKDAKPDVSKNSAGYFLWNVYDREKKTFNLNKLFVGSQGTLGMITKAKLRLVKPKTHSELLVMFLRDLNPLADIVNALKPFHPETYESFDDHTMSLAIRFLPDMIKRMKGNLIKLAFQFLPEAWMALTGGLPKLILIAEFTGDTEEEVVKTLKAAQAEINKRFPIKTHITKNLEETEKYWTIRRESFNLLRQHSSGLQTAPFIDDIIVHPKDLPQFLPELNKIFSKYPQLIYTIAGHAGDANFHIIPLMDLSKQSEREIIFKLSDEVYDLVLKYKGSISGEHNDGIIRTPYLEKMYGPKIVELFREVKRIFDPQNIFNPGKKVHVDIQYAMDHIRKK